MLGVEDNSNRIVYVWSVTAFMNLFVRYHPDQLMITEFVGFPYDIGIILILP